MFIPFGQRRDFSVLKRRARRLAPAWKAMLTIAALCLGPAQARAQCETFSFTNGPATFIPGTIDIGNHLDEAMTTVPLPFSVNMYGTSYNSVSVSSNGFAVFGADTQSYAHDCLPSSDFSTPVIFALWGDLRTDGSDSGQGVFKATLGTAPNRTFVIEWRANYYGLGDGDPALDFEIQFHEGQSYFDVVYATTYDGGANATAGAQGPTSNGFTPITQVECSAIDGLQDGESLRFSCAALPPAACCASDGTCTLTSPAGCDSGRVFLGDQASCTPTPCGPLGSCCASDGTCSVVAETTCTGVLFSAGGSCTPGLCVIANDDCANATVLTTASFPYSQTIVKALAHQDDIGMDGTAQSGVWFKFTAPSAGRLTYHSVNGNGGRCDSIYVFEPTCADNFSGLTSGFRNVHDLDASFTGIQPRGNYGLVAGQTVMVLVSDPPDGFFYFHTPIRTVTFNFTPSTAPTNDTCATAVDLTNRLGITYTTQVDNLLATTEASSCSGIYNGVWYSYTNNTSAPGYVLYSETSSQSAAWAIAPDCSTQPVCQTGQSGYVAVAVGQTVKFLVGSSVPMTAGQDSLHLTFQFLHDTCGNAEDLNAANLLGNPYETNVRLDLANDDDSNCFSVYHGVWFTYTNTAGIPGTLSFSGNSSQPATIAWATAPDCSTQPTCQFSNAGDVQVDPGHSIKVLVGVDSPLLDTGDTFTLDFSFNLISCPADFDQSQTINVSDIFAFLRAWFAHDPAADIDGSGTVNVSDIFAFLRHWFAHC